MMKFIQTYIGMHYCNLSRVEDFGGHCGSSDRCQIRTSVPELIADAKVTPGKIDMATSGVGTGSHAAAELSMMMRQTQAKSAL